MRTPVYVDVNIETPDPLQVNIKMEMMKEECENNLYQCPIEDIYVQDNAPSEYIFEEFKSLLPGSNKQTAKGDEAACSEAIGDEAACSEAIGDDKASSLKLSERK